MTNVPASCASSGSTLWRLVTVAAVQILASLKGCRELLAARTKTRRDIRLLSAMSDRDLHDIGISRCQIESAVDRGRDARSAAIVEMGLGPPRAMSATDSVTSAR